MISKGFNHLKQKIINWLPIVLCIGALYIIQNEFKAHELSAILSSLQTTPLWVIFAALALTALNYLILAGYDWLALHYTGHTQIPLPKMIPTALLGYAISNNTGYAWATGGSIRYRFYSKRGVPAWDMLKISLFQTFTYLLGAMSLGLLGSLILPYYLPSTSQNTQIIQSVTWVSAAFLVGYWGAICLWRKPLIIKGFPVDLPSPKLAVRQSLIACTDILVSAWVLWVLLPEQANLQLGTFLIVFVVAQAVGFVSQVPGGLGVFESAFLWLISNIADADQHLLLMSALLLYRAIYYLIPLLLAGAGLLGYELYNHRAVLIASGRTIKQMLALFMPKPYAFILLFSGIVLYNARAVSASLKPEYWQQAITPLTVIVISVLLGSLVCFSFLVIAQGANLTLNTAHDRRLNSRTNARAAIKDYGKRLMAQCQTPNIVLLLAATGLIMLIPQDHRILAWWRLFTENPHVSSAMHASWSIAALTTTLVIHRHFRIAVPKSLAKPSTYELHAAADIISRSEDARGYLALLGDKYLCWSEDRSAFIMFEVTSHYWIAMGDPIGNQQAITQLIWSFREQAHQYGAKAVFYQVSPAFLPYYLELGLNFYKLGEEAKINLSTFNLQGRSRNSQRGIRNRLTKQGFRFEIIDRDHVKPLLPELRAISDRWLASKHTGEKGFSLGFFDEAYLCRTDLAVARDEQHQIVAFANVLKTANQQELSFDLMRYNPDIQGGIMEFLCVELILWGQAQHYHWFLMGMAPLAGLKRHPLAPLWHKIGTVIFRQAEAFYNFEGIYRYKEKFDPVWEPRYLAAYSKYSVPLILLLITRLISGGWKGIFSRS